MRTAFVGGGGRGIGRAIALALAAQGFAVAVAARSGDELAAVVAEIEKAGGEAHALPTDLSSAEAAHDAIHAAHQKLGALEVLVNCAGHHPAGYPVEEYPLDYWQQILTVNLSIAFYSCRAAIPLMKAQRRGRIINISSAAGKLGAPNACGYVAAKHGLIGLTKVLAVELGTFGITANAICPGFVETRMTEGKDQLRQWVLGRSAVPRPVETDEVAALAVYLAGPQAAAITGQALSVCCGLTM